MKPIIMVHLVHKKPETEEGEAEGNETKNGDTLVFNLDQVRAIQTYLGKDDDMRTHISFVGEDPEKQGYRTSITVKQISEAIQRASREFSSIPSSSHAGPLLSVVIKEE